MVRSGRDSLLEITSFVLLGRLSRNKDIPGVGSIIISINEKLMRNKLLRKTVNTTSSRICLLLRLLGFTQKP
jgi:hypothetical protein